ncbi:HIT family protein [Tessaracoccus sp. SD287]|uniref:HIT family protein n=1 Tax=Tessaracoccus sp. SD287 TaxID=2782008 RepID=UPI00351C6656
MTSPDIFCQMIAGQAEVDPVLRTATSIAFLDHRPVFKGHVLVCPLEHVEDLAGLPAASVAGFFSDVQRVAAALPEALGCQGTFVAINNQVSQSVPHLHAHVVPRTRGDGLRGFFWPRHAYAEGQLVEYADRIRSALTLHHGQP